MNTSDSSHPDSNSRRDFFGVAAIGAIAAASLASEPAPAAIAAESGAESAFRRAFAGLEDGGLDVDARLSFLAPNASVVDHDVPYLMDVAGYTDHLHFLASHWEKVEWSIHELRVASHGPGAIVSCFYNERGKPRNAGFRLRAGFCTAVCTQDSGRWRALALHMSPLSAQILDASPS
jgi:hypothetical protein